MGSEFLATDTGVVYVGQEDDGGPEWVPTLVLAGYNEADGTVHARFQMSVTAETVESDEMRTDALDGGVTGGEPVTNTVGEGLEVTGGELTASVPGGRVQSAASPDVTESSSRKPRSFRE